MITKTCRIQWRINAISLKMKITLLEERLEQIEKFTKLRKGIYNEYSNYITR